jgi:2-polyprenyl-6-methoxyphenol hydroxylase-like FAD-dependent oxidoreductase
MKAHFLEENTPSTVDLYFFPGGYCGVSPVTSSELRGRPVLNVSTLVRKTGTASLAEVLTRNAALRQRSRSWRAISDTVTTYPLLFRPPHPVAGRVLLAGDAAGFIDPFAGDGIALALRTGAMAADALAPFWSGERTLSGAVDEYRRGYEMNVASLFRSSARIRRLITLPRLVRWPLAKLVRFTRWTPHLVAGTRMRPAPAPKHKSAA